MSVLKKAKAVLFREEKAAYTKDAAARQPSDRGDHCAGILQRKEARFPAIQGFHNAVPLIEYRNNEERQGDFEQLISLIDAYNLLQTDRISDKEAFVDAILVTFGFGLAEDDDDLKALKNGVLNAPSREDGADISWLTKSFDETQVNLLSQSIENDIHKISYVPNMNEIGRAHV